MRVRAERCASLFRSARTLTPTPLPEGEGLYVALRTDATVIPQPSNRNPSPSGRRWRQPDEGTGGAVHITLALRPYPHPNPSPGGRGDHHTVSKWNPSPSGSTRGAHMDVRGSEERGRWRQPDEGSGGAVHITLALRPFPHPIPSPGGRGDHHTVSKWNPAHHSCAPPEPSPPPLSRRERGSPHRSKLEPFSLREKVAAAG